MIRQCMYGASLGLALLSGILVQSTSAEAREPATSTLVTQVTPSLPTSHLVDGATAWVGIRGCERMVSRDEMVAVLFRTQMDTTAVGADGLSLFKEAVWYGLERGSATNVDCATDDRCRQIPSENVNQTAEEIQVSVPMRTLVGFTNSALCESSAIDQEFFLRIYLRSDVVSATWIPVEGRIIIDTVRPEPPSGLTAVATQNTVRVEYTPSPSTDTSRHVAVVSTSPFEGGEIAGESQQLRPVSRIREGVGEIEVSQTAGTSLYVALAAQDETGNYSILSEVVETEVVQTIDFWDDYREAGGAEEGGYCSAAGGAQGPLGLLWPALMVAGYLGFVRRRRPNGRGWTVAASALTLVTGAVVAAPNAYAQSATHGTAQVKVGSYLPDIDAEFNGSGPYERFFDHRSILLLEASMTGYVWQGFGKLGVGVSAGYGRVTGPVVAADGGELETTDSTSLRTLPLRASLVYRVDQFQQRWNIPLVPVVEGGVDYVLWRAVGADGETSVADGVRGAGGKLGWHVSGGLHLLLNIFDPSSAAAFDMNWGINGSYLFAEYVMLRADGFGQAGFDFSDDHFMFGLSFEF
jgi:MYXO-CTERM domain-containing protein